jgi:hypothetical protein
VIDTRCPEGVALLFPLSIFAGLGSAALMGWKGSRLGGYWGAMVMLAWPALFISLGFNFLQYALVPPPPATGIVWGWLIPGVLFELMGGLPLLAFLPSGRSRRKGRGFGPRVRDAAAEGEARYANQLPRARARLLNGLAAHAEDRAVSTTSRQVAPPTRAEEPDLVSQLERLAALHRSGSLTYDEFQRAKAALLGHSA